MNRRLLAPLATVIMLFATAAPAFADNSAVAVNTKNNSTVFDLSFKIEQIAGAIVNPVNTALAYASCTSCTTVAIAVDIVFVIGSPTTYTPTNQAIAVNYLCVQCNTLASAYQFVIQAPGPLEFTEEGRRQIREIEKALARLRKENLTIPELNARVNDLMAQLKTVLATQLVPADRKQNDQEGSEQTQSSGGESSTTESARTGTSSTTTTQTTTSEHPVTSSTHS
jgi:putative peptide zinc metalloprotease protein